MIQWLNGCISARQPPEGLLSFLFKAIQHLKQSLWKGIIDCCQSFFGDTPSSMPLVSECGTLKLSQSLYKRRRSLSILHSSTCSLNIEHSRGKKRWQFCADGWREDKLATDTHICPTMFSVTPSYCSETEPWVTLRFLSSSDSRQISS